MDNCERRRILKSQRRLFEAHPGEGWDSMMRLRAKALMQASGYKQAFLRKRAEAEQYKEILTKLLEVNKSMEATLAEVLER